MYSCEGDYCDLVIDEPEYVGLPERGVDADGFPLEEILLCPACYSAWIAERTSI